MKNLKTFLVLILVIILGSLCFSSVGCKIGNASSSVSGKTYGFYHIKMVGGGITLEYHVGDNMPNYGVLTEEFSMITFNEDGTFKEVNAKILDTGTWTQKGNKVTITYNNLPVGTTSLNAEYTVSSNFIINSGTEYDPNYGQITATVKYKLTEASFPTHFVSVNSGFSSSYSSSSYETSSVSSKSSKLNWANEVSISQNSQEIFTFTSEGEITGLTAYGNGLSTLYIPSYINGTKIETISANAFANKTMTSVYVLPGIKTIGENAFINCSNLTTVHIADSVKLIDSGAFYCCIYLNDVVFGANLQKISYNAFALCSRIQEIVIPKKVNYIGSNAFGGCSRLNSVIFEYTSGWKVSDDSTSNLYNISVTDAEKNAKNLNEFYADRYWQNVNL